MAEQRRQRLKGLHINRMIPNVLTLLALAAGLSALRFSLQERWDHAVLAILVAAILDGLDGRIARILKGATRFGAELNSLSDFLCFGVAPAFTLYLWALVDAGRIGWALVLLLCICCALRLARFNTAEDEDERPAWSRNFFVGVPSPGGRRTGAVSPRAVVSDRRRVPASSVDRRHLHAGDVTVAGQPRADLHLQEGADRAKLGAAGDARSGPLSRVTVQRDLAYVDPDARRLHRLHPVQRSPLSSQHSRGAGTGGNAGIGEWRVTVKSAAEPGAAT